MVKHKKSYRDNEVGHDQWDGRLVNYNVVRQARRGSKTMDI